MHESFYREARVAVIHLHSIETSLMIPSGRQGAVLLSLSSNSVSQCGNASVLMLVDASVALALTHINDKAGSTAAATA